MFRLTQSKLAAFGIFGGLGVGALGFLLTAPPLAQGLQQAAPPARGAHADLPGVRIWFTDTGGAGIPVVFLHASTGNTRIWERQIPAFTAAGYRFIAYDRRGWGRTEIDPSGPQPGNSADDLNGLMDFLGVDRFHLVATAAGGSVALDYTLSFPQRVRSLVVANSVGRLEDREYRDLAGSLRIEGYDDLPRYFRELSPTYRASNPEGTRRWRELEAMSRPPGPVPEAQPLRTRLTLAALENIRVPTLLIAGGADLSAPPPLQRFYIERIPHAETLIVPNAGHSVFWELPQVFNRAVLDFIGKH